MAILMAGLATAAAAESWTISTHYLRLNQANPGGSTDNFGIGVSYDWQVSDEYSFAVEAIGSWDEPAELYGCGVNMKNHMVLSGDIMAYCGGYIDYIYARSLPSKAQGGPGGSEDGFIYGPLIGIKAPIGDNKHCFAQYQYGWVDGGSLRKAFDEANWIIVGIEMRF